MRKSISRSCISTLAITTWCTTFVSGFFPSFLKSPSLHRVSFARRPNSRVVSGDRTYIIVRGIDFDALEEFEECDFLDGDLSQVDLTKCLPAPSTSLPPNDVVSTCLDCLLVNIEPKLNAGLEVCWNFSSSNCRAGKISLLRQCKYIYGVKSRC